MHKYKHRNKPGDPMTNKNNFLKQVLLFYFLPLFLINIISTNMYPRPIYPIVEPILYELKDRTKTTLIFLKNHPSGCLKGLTVLAFFILIQKYRHAQAHLRELHMSLDQTKKELTVLQKSHTDLDLQTQKNTESLTEQEMSLCVCSSSYTKINGLIASMGKKIKSLQENR